MTPGALANLVLSVLTLMAALPVVVLFFQLATAAFARTTTEPRTESGTMRKRRVAVLMPAHEEAKGIVAPILAVLAQLGPRDRLLVVADNCHDATAAVARSAGAEVVERNDPTRRGKGYALDFGVRSLELDAPDVVVIVDADCLVGPHALDRLVEASHDSGRPVQALYLMHAPPGARVGIRIAQFAWLVKNKLRPSGFAAWGLPCQLMGTGMAFPWKVIRDAPLATAHLVEDMQLGLDLAASGIPPLFCGEAAVDSWFPSDSAGAKSQRTRWEQGHLSVIASAAPRMVLAAVRQSDPRLLAMALDLMVPPLASLVLLLAGVFVVDAGAWIAGAGGLPFALAVTSWVFMIAAIALAWFKEGRKVVSATDLLALPFYVFGKIPVYVGLLRKRQVEWIRTRRDDRSNR